MLVSKVDHQDDDKYKLPILQETIDDGLICHNLSPVVFNQTPIIQQMVMGSSREI
jgi:hypothetical protein